MSGLFVTPITVGSRDKINNEDYCSKESISKSHSIDEVQMMTDHARREC